METRYISVLGVRLKHRFVGRVSLGYSKLTYDNRLLQPAVSGVISSIVVIWTFTLCHGAHFGHSYVLNSFCSELSFLARDSGPSCCLSSAVL